MITRYLKHLFTLEKNNQLEQAKKNPQSYDLMLQMDLSHGLMLPIDLPEFQDSSEFKSYLTKQESLVNRNKGLFYGFLITVPAEIFSFIFSFIFCYIRSRKNIIFQGTEKR